VSRAQRTYTDRREWVAPAGYGIDAGEPVAGFYKIKLGADTVACGVQLEFGPPRDPETGETMDRSWRWMATLDDGTLCEIDRVWPKCAADPISQVEFSNLCARREWARQHAPDSAYAKPGRKLDRLSPQTPMQF
jgi:hypothetical protein